MNQYGAAGTGATALVTFICLLCSLRTRISRSLTICNFYTTHDTTGATTGSAHTDAAVQAVVKHMDEVNRP
jgi:hypothetical protein